MKKIILAVGARPNFMKAAPLFYELDKCPFADPILVHTGQHYDFNMSQAFFSDFDLPEPAFNLEVGSGSHAEQTGNILIRFDSVLEETRPDMVIVFGDVNSTIACSLSAKKTHIPVAHVEAGLRSRDRSMPEEINRILTDCISDILFTHCEDANDNLSEEGIRSVDWKKIMVDRSNFQFDSPVALNVGNVMIDSLVKILSRIDASYVQTVLHKLGAFDSDSSVRKPPFGLVTLHRPFNVDSELNLRGILDVLNTISDRLILLFPVHPRTEMKISKLSPPFKRNKKFILTQPLGYREFVALEKEATLVITDSGGIQEETSYMKVPCLTLRPNTERPVTISEGTNRMVSIDTLADEVDRILSGGQFGPGRDISLWDGQAARRMTDVLKLYFESDVLSLH
ncbi:non-hydrolyzing UDP-N-acetylglucosamine 2-epimerase [Acidobacteriota bacterium]